MTATTPPTPAYPEPPRREETSSSTAIGAPDEAGGPGPLVADHRRRPVAAAFRLAGTHRPQPPGNRVLGAFTWVTALGVVGLAVALRGLTEITAGTEPSWYQPTLASLGLVGVGLTVAGMVLAQRTRHLRLPWVVLGLATVPVTVNLFLALGAL